MDIQIVVFGLLVFLTCVALYAQGKVAHLGRKLLLETHRSSRLCSLELERKTKLIDLAEKTDQEIVDWERAEATWFQCYPIDNSNHPS